MKPITSKSGQGSDSLDLRVRRWAGWFGVGAFVVFLVALPLYFIGVGPAAPLADTAQYSDLITRTNTFILIRTAVADPLIMVGLLVFMAGFPPPGPARERTTSGLPHCSSGWAWS
jgi:hypothetical protein